MVIEEIIASVVTGGIGTGALIKFLPMLLKRTNGKRNGKSAISIKEWSERGTKIADHDAKINGLSSMIVDQKKQAETNRRENREDHIRMEGKLDLIRVASERN